MWKEILNNFKSSTSNLFKPSDDNEVVDIVINNEQVIPSSLSLKNNQLSVPISKSGIIFPSDNLTPITPPIISSNIDQPNLLGKVVEKKVIKFSPPENYKKHALQKLNDSIESFNIWRKNNDFTPLWIDNVDLGGMNLEGVNWKGCILVKVDLSDTILKNSSFKGAILRNVGLTEANLTGVDLNDIDITSVYGLDYEFQEIKSLKSNRWFLPAKDESKNIVSEINLDRLDEIFTKLFNYNKIKEILKYAHDPQNINVLMQKINHEKKGSFRNQYLKPLIRSGLIEMTIPELPRSPNQSYKTTSIGNQYLKKFEN